MNPPRVSLIFNSLSRLAIKLIFSSLTEITQILSNLKCLAQGKSFSFSSVSAKNTVQYNEQIYYLSTYGSYQGLLSFYLKHDEWKLALSYILEQQLEPDVFVEAVLLSSFKYDQQNKFKSELLALDPSLESFKVRYTAYYRRDYYETLIKLLV